MKRTIEKMAACAIGGCVCASLAATEGGRAYPASRYDPIVKREPFGAEPLTGTPQPDPIEQRRAAEANAAAMNLSKRLRLCFLLKSESGEVRAGFENKAPKPEEPKSIVLMKGESFMGMTLSDVDVTSASATLEYNGTPIRFELTKKPSPAKVVPKKSTTRRPPPRRLGGGFRRPQPPPQPELSPEERKKRREEVRKHLREYQMEVIRKGMPPLPIPLTKEMDDQLVSEGVLPPLEE